MNTAFRPCSYAASLAAALALAGTLAACEREDRRFSELAPFSNVAMSQAHSGLQPALTSADGELPRNARVPSKGLYDYNAWHISEGKHLFVAFNCNGCHGQGGGGEGPSLMDNRFRYGSEPGNLFASIVEGRPNGMPSFRGKVTQQQVWQLVSYLRALAGMVPLDAMPSRSDSLNGHPSEGMLRHDGNPRPEGVP
ncbi:MAG: cytochrome c class [Myxococcaceae bacterium]|nr:cytochrome c class [Myxococcaceae bacterium]